MSVLSVEHVVVTDDPGSKPGQSYARRRDRQITFGKLSINLGLRAERILSWYNILSGFGGLGVACWPLVPKFAGSNPAEAVGFLGAKKSSARLPSEGK